ncbi:DUF3784 domain-containing protein [Streptomyces sp. NPDC090109]|uniref:DUF3784 domain-containing protein n=1 Tax=Streptomyces TaxID=1883 RepID=UPI000EF820D9|nr:MULTISPECIES: DUF3784 domain-containing protein [unclassified Streptomyces]MZE53422.1 hypothetical protein [Streptomyces sp. SID5770]
MTTTGKQRVLYRQGTGFWRMTAKWIVVFGALYLLDGGLIRSWGDALVWVVIGILLWVPFGIGVVWYAKKDHLVTLTTHELRVRRRRLPMDRVNLLHVARLWLEGRSTADERPVAEWARADRVVWVPLHDGRAHGVEFRDPAAFAKAFGDFAVTACGGPEAVRARAATAAYPEPRPMRARSSDNGSWPDLLDLFD